MHTFKGQRRRWIALALAAAAVTAPAAEAAGPDDRPFYRGGAANLAPASQGPDDRALYRGGADNLAPTGLSPDDRPLSRSGPVAEPTSAPVAIISAPQAFDWADAAVGGAFGLVLALLGTGGILIAYRRRGAPTTA